MFECALVNDCGCCFDSESFNYASSVLDWAKYRTGEYRLDISIDGVDVSFAVDNTSGSRNYLRFRGITDGMSYAYEDRRVSTKEAVALLNQIRRDQKIKHHLNPLRKYPV